MSYWRSQNKKTLNKLLKTARLNGFNLQFTISLIRIFAETKADKRHEHRHGSFLDFNECTEDGDWIDVPIRSMLDQRLLGYRLFLTEKELIEARLLSAAKQLLGSDSAAQSWLNKPAAALNGQTPRLVAQSKAGAERVLRLLNQISHGICP